ncbi:hypothetical protein J1N35_044651 [Gossypium stocksii]|uniref:Uncharacterized protein n=1 Tax=Gossypium stocksii TaxID=47602 RepID=A0A9D3U9L6_9ROSI|nr:hypothetical protein J1N35_044651 [Gossypium stocksii]
MNSHSSLQFLLFLSISSIFLSLSSSTNDTDTLTLFRRQANTHANQHRSSKARLVGVSYNRSGSEHSAAIVVEDDDSPRLSELVHNFLEDDLDAAEQTGYNSDSDRVDSNLDFTDSLEIIIKSTSLNNTDAYRNLLMAHVLRAMEMLSFFKTNKAIFNRKVMAYFSEVGHNAAIYKTKWSSS